MASPHDPTLPLPAVLGWANGSDGTAGGENLRLYALDAGPSPRWDDGGRTIERAIRERHPNYEGDRYLVIRVGDRHEAGEVLPAAWMEDVARLWEEIGKDPHLQPTAQQLAELIRRASPELAAAIVAHLQLQVDESHRCWIENHAGELAHLRAQRATSVERVAAAIRCYADTDDGEPLHELDEHAEPLAAYLAQRGHLG